MNDSTDELLQPDSRWQAASPKSFGLRKDSTPSLGQADDTGFVRRVPIAFIHADTRELENRLDVWLDYLKTEIKAANLAKDAKKKQRLQAILVGGTAVMRAEIVRLNRIATDLTRANSVDEQKALLTQLGDHREFDKSLEVLGKKLGEDFTASAEYAELKKAHHTQPEYGDFDTWQERLAEEAKQNIKMLEAKGELRVYYDNQALCRERIALLGQASSVYAKHLRKGRRDEQFAVEEAYRLDLQRVEVERQPTLGRWQRVKQKFSRAGANSLVGISGSGASSVGHLTPEEIVNAKFVKQKKLVIGTLGITITDKSVERRFGEKTDKISCREFTAQSSWFSNWFKGKVKLSNFELLMLLMAASSNEDGTPFFSQKQDILMTGFVTKHAARDAWFWGDSKPLTERINWDKVEEYLEQGFAIAGNKAEFVFEDENKKLLNAFDELAKARKWDDETKARKKAQWIAAHDDASDKLRHTPEQALPPRLMFFPTLEEISDAYKAFKKEVLTNKADHEKALSRHKLPVAETCLALSYIKDPSLREVYIKHLRQQLASDSGLAADHPFVTAQLMGLTTDNCKLYFTDEELLAFFNQDPSKSEAIFQFLYHDGLSPVSCQCYIFGLLAERCAEEADELARLESVSPDPGTEDGKRLAYLKAHRTQLTELFAAPVSQTDKAGKNKKLSQETDFRRQKELFAAAIKAGDKPEVIYDLFQQVLNQQTAERDSQNRKIFPADRDRRLYQLLNQLSPEQLRAFFSELVKHDDDGVKLFTHIDVNHFYLLRNKAYPIAFHQDKKREARRKQEARKALEKREDKEPGNLHREKADLVKPHKNPASAFEKFKGYRQALERKSATVKVGKDESSVRDQVDLVLSCNGTTEQKQVAEEAAKELRDGGLAVLAKAPLPRTSPVDPSDAASKASLEKLLDPDASRAIKFHVRFNDTHSMAPDRVHVVGSDQNVFLRLSTGVRGLQTLCQNVPGATVVKQNQDIPANAHLFQDGARCSFALSYSKLTAFFIHDRATKGGTAIKASKQALLSLRHAVAARAMPDLNTLFAEEASWSDEQKTRYALYSDNVNELNLFLEAVQANGGSEETLRAFQDHIQNLRNAVANQASTKNEDEKAADKYFLSKIEEVEKTWCTNQVTAFVRQGWREIVYSLPKRVFKHANYGVVQGILEKADNFHDAMDQIVQHAGLDPAYKTQVLRELQSAFEAQTRSLLNTLPKAVVTELYGDTPAETVMLQEQQRVRKAGFVPNKVYHWGMFKDDSTNVTDFTLRTINPEFNQAINIAAFEAVLPLKHSPDLAQRCAKKPSLKRRLDDKLSELRCIISSDNTIASDADFNVLIRNLRAQKFPKPKKGSDEELINRALDLIIAQFARKRNEFIAEGNRALQRVQREAKGAKVSEPDATAAISHAFQQCCEPLSFRGLGLGVKQTQFSREAKVTCFEQILAEIEKEDPSIPIADDVWAQIVEADDATLIELAQQQAINRTQHRTIAMLNHLVHNGTPERAAAIWKSLLVLPTDTYSEAQLACIKAMPVSSISAETLTCLFAATYESRDTKSPAQLGQIYAQFIAHIKPRPSFVLASLSRALKQTGANATDQAAIMQACMLALPAESANATHGDLLPPVSAEIATVKAELHEVQCLYGDLRTLSMHKLTNNKHLNRSQQELATLASLLEMEQIFLETMQALTDPLQSANANHALALAKLKTLKEVFRRGGAAQDSDCLIDGEGANPQTQLHSRFKNSSHGKDLLQQLNQSISAFEKTATDPLHVPENLRVLHGALCESIKQQKELLNQLSATDQDLYSHFPSHYKVRQHDRYTTPKERLTSKRPLTGDLRLTRASFADAKSAFFGPGGSIESLLRQLEEIALQKPYDEAKKERDAVVKEIAENLSQLDGGADEIAKILATLKYDDNPEGQNQLAFAADLILGLSALPPNGLDYDVLQKLKDEKHELYSALVKHDKLKDVERFEHLNPTAVKNNIVKLVTGASPDFKKAAERLNHAVMLNAPNGTDHRFEAVVALFDKHSTASSEAGRKAQQQGLFNALPEPLQIRYFLAPADAKNTNGDAEDYMKARRQALFVLSTNPQQLLKQLITEGASKGVENAAELLNACWADLSAKQNDLLKGMLTNQADLAKHFLAQAKGDVIHDALVEYAKAHPSEAKTVFKSIESTALKERLKTEIDQDEVWNDIMDIKLEPPKPSPSPFGLPS